MMMQYLDDAVATCEQLLDAPAPAPLPQAWAQACQTVGNILTSMGFIEEAYPWRSMAFDESPNSAKFYAESGRIYSQCELWERALYFCQRTLDYQPDNVAVRCRLAKIHHQLGDYQAESQTLNALLALRPDKANAAGHHQLGQVLQKQGQRALARACYQRAIEQESDFAPAYYALGELLGQQGQWTQVIEWFEQLTAQQPDNAMAHYRLGRAYRQSQQPERAIAQFRRALQLDSTLHWAHMGLLNTLMQQRQWQVVIETCQAHLSAEPDSPWAYSFMGNASAAQGQMQEATQAHRRAFALRGWTQCETRDYRFTRTWFSESMPVWAEHLTALRLNAGETEKGRSPLKVLSLGSSEGDSNLCWLTDQVLTQPDDQLICLTCSVSPQLRHNWAIGRSAAETAGSTSTVVLQEVKALSAALSDPPLAWAGPERDAGLDAVIIQSDRKQGAYLHSLAAQVWRYIRPDGLLFFKDYQWRHPSDPSQSAQAGIDAFLISIVGQAEILHQSHQVILKKGSTPHAQ